MVKGVDVKNHVAMLTFILHYTKFLDENRAILPGGAFKKEEFRIAQPTSHWKKLKNKMSDPPHPL